MTEEEKESVDQKDQGVLEPSQAEAQQASQASPDDQRKRNAEEYNWAEARRKMQDLERSNREMSETLRAMQQKDAPQPVEDELDKLGDDELMTKAQARKMATKMAKEVSEQVMRQHAASTVEERVKLKFPDYDEVVSKDNIETFKKLQPELALSLAHNPDPYAQAVAVYNALKMVGMGKEDPAKYEKDKAAKNSQKPVSVNAVTKNSAIGNAHLFENGLTPDLKKALYKEMQQAIRQG